MPSTASVITASAILLLLPITARAQFAGKSYEGLAKTISIHCRPSEFVGNPIAVFPLTDGNSDGSAILDRFDNRIIAPDEAAVIDITPARWWTECTDPAHDLYNLLPGNSEVNSIKRDFPPGNVTNPTWDNGLWMVGTTQISGIDCEFFTPPLIYQGDMARIYMYIATVYATPALSPRAFMMMDGSLYPSLTSYSASILLDWHRKDPPDDLERNRNNAIEAIQGNRNPFVDFPEMAEYLWGNLKGKPFAVEGTITPLHSVYTIEDEYVNLISPEIPADAIWTVDDNPVRDTAIPVSTLDNGAHHLKFNSPSTGITGCVMIKIEK